LFQPSHSRREKRRRGRGQGFRPPEFSVSQKHFLDITAFPLHPVSHCRPGNDEGAALAKGVIGEKFFKARQGEVLKGRQFQIFLN
jgi:hypothetical protein